ncbi:hypothetical protein EIL87_04945 [Saccharopolyspora rhizosphaerae]|uniref:DNA-binding protein n=1 Tax=Saccharopolyspora rhizosphaerae TaxID=2492662 RepID=A0A426K0K7_9PSEU|nr:hypothetical protein [Saccharopolyspora rhizosphaerae]RRO18863.1 hypothetical protein EIL87_04945 [Saccharopolyspora rhizosphaerae]
MGQEQWDRHDIAAYLGIQVNSVNAWLSRHGIAPVARRPAGRGALANLYDADEVKRVREAGRRHRKN